MRTIISAFVFCVSIPYVCFSQQECLELQQELSRLRQERSEWREAERSLVFSVVEKHASNYIEGRSFLVFSIFGQRNNKTHLIVVEEDGLYRELRIRNDSLVNIEIREPNETLKLAFHKEIYHTGSKDLADFPEKLIHPPGNGVYFSFVDKGGNLYGESFTTVFSPLINREVHFYLLIRIANPQPDLTRNNRRWLRWRNR